MILYLDTHVLVWLYEGRKERFTSRGRAALDHARLVISPMVELELAYLWESKRITVRPDAITAYLIERIGLARDTSPFSAIAAAAVPLRWTRDPFDRLITATAILNDCPLLSKDKTIRDHYAEAWWGES